MVSSKAASVSEYIASLPAERQKEIKAVRTIIRKNLPRGFEEGMQYGMIGYYVPLERHPDTYNGQPLTVAALCSQKQHLSLYLMGVYGDQQLRDRFERAYRKSGKKLDMGKSCLRFKSLDDLPLDVIGKVVASTPVERYIEIYEGTRK